MYKNFFRIVDRTSYFSNSKACTGLSHSVWSGWIPDDAPGIGRRSDTASATHRLLALRLYPVVVSWSSPLADLDAYFRNLVPSIKPSR